MKQRLMDVHVGVRFVAIPGNVMGMPMVRIVRMGVCMFLLPVCVQMTVMFSEVRPDASRHQQSHSDESPRDDIALNEHR